jgi:thymidylate synthase
MIDMNKEQILREILNIYKIQAIDLSIMYKIEFGDDVIAEIKRLQDLLEEESSIDRQYQTLLKDILDNGVEKKDRTGTGTLSVFGRQIRHKMSDGFPVLTTKKMAWKTMVTELLWFLRGDTNIKFLVDNNCHIWDGDCYQAYIKRYNKGEYVGKTKLLENSKKNRTLTEPFTKEEFINKIKTDDEFAKQWGELGPIYGKQWRKWGRRNVTNYDLKDVKGSDQPKVLEAINNGEDVTKYGVKIEYQNNSIDQITNLINDLKTNPDSRRLMVNAWNVGELDQMVLPPCHYGFQVYTRELSHDERFELYKKVCGRELQPHISGINFKQLHFDEFNVPIRAISLMWNQRSVDTFLGLPFNIASYGLLLEIIAKEVNMVPDELIGNLGDVHLYSNHIEQAKEQISREPYPLPKLIINDEFWNHEHQTVDGWVKGMEIGDFMLEGYQSHPSIKAPLSN